MGLLFTCFALLLIYFSPNEVVPALVKFRPLVLTLGIASVASVATLAMRPVRKLQQPQYVLVLGIWVAIVLSHLSHLWIRTAAYSIVEFGPSAVLFFLISINGYTTKRLKIIGGVMIFCGVVLAIQGAFAYYTGWNADQLMLYGSEDFRSLMGNRIRGYGTLKDPNDLAQFFLVAIALLGLYWKKSSAANVLLVVPASVLLFGVYLTFSRGAMLGLCAVVYVLAYHKMGRVLSTVGAGLMFILLQLVQFTGGRDIAVDKGRMVAWGAGIAGLLHRPLFGIGYGHFGDINDLTAHNSFVLCFAELGFFGYFFWLALILTTVIGLWGVASVIANTAEDEAVSTSARAIQAALAAFLVTSFFLSRTYHETLYIILAMAANVIQMRTDAVPKTALFMNRWAPRTIMWEFASVVLVYVLVRLRTI
jgi:putative inorganic carbon (HCO3(-)) transporter